ncbi:40S ribosomal protein S5-1 [Hordeum vulgare]|nr:40S ribosomal protein S5-1 [Hordeum vulgare]
MAASSSSKDKFFDNVINPYLREVMQHPQAIQMRDGVLHIRDVEGPKGTGSMEATLETMEKEVFWCKGMVERGLNTNHLMIADYTRDVKVDCKSMKDIVFSLNEQINFLHSQIHDLQSQVFEYEPRFKGPKYELVEWYNSCELGIMNMQVLLGMVCLTTWMLWKHHNTIVFDNATPNVELHVYKIIEKGKAWVTPGLLKGNL